MKKLRLLILSLAVLAALSLHARFVQAEELVNLGARIELALARFIPWKKPARTIATGTVTASGLQTVDGVSLVHGDRVLLAGQSSAVANGLYTVNSAGAWPRATDAADTTAVQSAFVCVSEGSVYANTCWVQQADGVVVGSSSQTWAQLSGGGGGGGNGTVTSVSVTTANGVSGTVTNPTTTPAITLSLGAITPTTVNGRTVATDGTTLDTHVANTSNPHSVTKAQVGLANVTNDAQLKRAADDFASFTSKPSAASLDICLIEDSAAAGAKKSISVSGLTPGLTVMTGDSGSGGAKGLVPAPAAGDALKALRGDGTYSTSLNGTAIPASKTLVVTTDIGTSVQAQDAELAAVAGLASSAHQLIYFTGSGTAGMTTCDASCRSALASLANTNTGDQFTSVTASRLLGRGSAAGAGAAQEITVGSGLSLSGTTLSATGGGTGDVVGPASAVDSNLCAFDLTTGKLIKDSGKATPAGAVVGTTDPQTLSSKTLSSPTIADFTNATHAHTSAAGGGALDTAAITTGTFATARVADDAITYAKIQNVATDRLLGRDGAGSGDVEELTCGGGLEFTGTGGIQVAAFTGDVTKAAGGTALTIANDAVTLAKLVNATAPDKFVCRVTAGAGDFEECTITSAGRALADDADAAAQRVTLGVANLTTQYIGLPPGAAELFSTNPPEWKKVDGTNFPVDGYAFDATTDEQIAYTFRAVRYGSGNATLTLYWYADTASTGSVVWVGELSCITANADTQDVETDAFATANTVTDAHIGTTGQRLHSVDMAISNLDALAADDLCVLRVSRDANHGSDDMAGDAILRDATFSYSTL